MVSPFGGIWNPGNSPDNARSSLPASPRGMTNGRCWRGVRCSAVNPRPMSAAKGCATYPSRRRSRCRLNWTSSSLRRRRPKHSPGSSLSRCPRSGWIVLWAVRPSRAWSDRPIRGWERGVQAWPAWPESMEESMPILATARSHFLSRSGSKISPSSAGTVSQPLA